MIAGVALLAGGVSEYFVLRPEPAPDASGSTRVLHYQPRIQGDSGVGPLVMGAMEKWSPSASLDEVAWCWNTGLPRLVAKFDHELATRQPTQSRIQSLMFRAVAHTYTGHAELAYSMLSEARELASAAPHDAEVWLYKIIYLQGITALRRGENENCVMCRGESSCILPISPAALHKNPEGSRLAIEHFTEYLTVFPDDIQVRWLLNVAHMTIGEHPDKVDSMHLIRIDPWVRSEFDLGRFRDVGELVGINRFNESGAALVDDFDNDGLLDVLFTCWNAAVPLVLYRNKGDGTFEDVTEKAKLRGQLGGLGATQTDYDNDGHLDIYLPRGAWLTSQSARACCTTTATERSRTSPRRRACSIR